MCVPCDEFLKGVRDVLSMVGETLVNDEGRFRFGTHSLRRGGAQALARMGWSVPSIQRWGRWASDTIFTYILSMEFAVTWGDVAPAMIGMARQELERETGQTDMVPVGYKGRKPVKGDTVSIWSQSHKKWLLATVLLTPTEQRPKKLREAHPVWPLGDTVHLVECVSHLSGVGNMVVPFALDVTNNWLFASDPMANVPARESRVLARATARA